MASSFILAVLQKLDSLTYTGTAPKYYFDEAPQTDDAGQQQRLTNGYGILHDNGLEPEYQSDHGGLEVGTFTLQIYGITLADVDAIVNVVKWGGAVPGNLAGLDFCTLVLTSPLYFISLQRTSERRAYAGFDYLQQRCHLCELVYRATGGISASG